MQHRWFWVGTVWMALWLATADAADGIHYFRTLDAMLLKDKDDRIVDILAKGTYLMLEGNATAPFRVSRVLEHGHWKKRTGLIKEAGIDVTVVVNQAHYNGSARYILVTKSHFLLELFEFDNTNEYKLYETEVGLGMDRCLPPEEGGRCYYTEPGTYHVRWKVYDPEGIEWCIPDYMINEKRYAEDVDAGQRCFRGNLGKYALNIGASYAIHGTTDTSSLGQKKSHGCIRTGIEPMRTLYFLMDEGDPVFIVP